ncbi:MULTISPECIES: DUF1330 domain-containing protein [Paenibacillus]|uniref:DUF1330 domain-containing protein n=1 Tax=Paenibacillus helianthi TaxID=1349432 RepID=A0ABX3EP54_9BACL|nr:MULTISPECIES: DUF1330 domain-containing protein [Paenibacillus]OKP85473.1 hypothetical protein A3844_16200 [Paenibacillus helianthi]OKP86286.1 hypothetical protein A3848_21705 [Paenibacillus sp. P32E]OKP88216.1 hypothetical protein A3842_05745 [Paenibacillus sp. P3E]
MSAFVIFIREQSQNPEELGIYSQKAPGGLAGHPVTLLAMYGTHEVIEGPAMEGAAILEFPSFEEAKAWYYSPAYQDAVQHRLRGGTYRGFIIEGVSTAVTHSEEDKK